MEKLENAISSGDYGPLQDFLLDQAVLLNKTGVDFIELSTATGDGRDDALHIALRIFRESRKTVRAVKRLGAEK